MWEKKGFIFRPDQQFSWNQSHAQLPLFDDCGNYWRVYFATRDTQGRSNISYLNLEPGKPQNILYVHDQTILDLGKLGTFDESGIMPLSIVNKGQKKYLYYAGWTQRQTIPYHNSIGLAISEDGGETYAKIGEGPIFDLLPDEPYFTGTICVHERDNRWQAWYQSCTEWVEVGGKPEPKYHLKYAESEDGIHWKRPGKVAIDYLDEEEGGICCASVLKSDQYEMWFSHRKISDYRDNKENSYRIGYASSVDGINWNREDSAAGIGVSREGWDSEMITYPCVFLAQGRRYMFYNGNGFGRSGFGFAEWIEP